MDNSWDEMETKTIKLSQKIKDRIHSMNVRTRYSLEDRTLRPLNHNEIETLLEDNRNLHEDLQLLEKELTAGPTSKERRKTT